MHTHEDGPFRMFIHITRAVLLIEHNKLDFFFFDSATEYELFTYKVSIHITRVPTIQMKLGISGGRQMLHEGRSWCEPLCGVLLLQTMRLALSMMIAMGLYIGWHRGSSAIAGGCGGCIVNWSSIALGHFVQRKKEGKEAKRKGNEGRSIRKWSGIL